MRNIFLLMAIIAVITLVPGCKSGQKHSKETAADSTMKAKLAEYVTVKLNPDLGLLTEKERQMIPLLIEAADIVDKLFWKQTMADHETFLAGITDSVTRAFAMINYGPWERLNGNKPFMEGFGEKPAGANFYPVDMTKEEFEKWDNKDKKNEYTIIRRNEDSTLKAVFYHEAFKADIERAANLLTRAAVLAEDAGLKKYLELRAKAFLSDDYFESDMAWMEMKTNTIDVVIGPIENYEDELFGYKNAYEGLILMKDKEWSKKLEKFIAFLPELQKQLPVDGKYKKEVPGTESDLNAYDVLYVSGQANEGSKTIAINLPNDERVQMRKGARRLQLKNAMKAKFDNILVPIANVVIDPSQTGYISFDAFFSNVMFHEVAHGLGIKNTVTGKGMVREALKEKYSSFEEAKADILGLFMVNYLIDKGELKDVTHEQAYVTYMAGIIRSVRFGAASSHGKANMMCFNFFQDKGAFTQNPDGTYKVDLEKTKEAMNEWAAKVLIFEGDGDYDGASAYLEQNGKIRPELQKVLDNLKTSKIPVDIVYEQGVEALGLK
ncbi:MAG: Zn-dependent hydrolase [Bacteroidetes bacterium]|nr:Zn-dependent hydrolase [Bacteroidota bacterium]